MTQHTTPSERWRSSAPLPARTPAQAVDALVAPLQLAVSCVTDAVLVATGYRSSADPHQILFRRPGAAAGLRRSHATLLAVLIAYDLARSGEDQRHWQARIVGYRCQLLDRNERLIVGFHWHPHGLSPITFPHVHIGARVGGIDFSKVHIPTGVVSLQAVVRFAIAEVGVEPLREDWRDALAAEA